jgi:hypothetical protein
MRTTNKNQTSTIIFDENGVETEESANAFMNEVKETAVQKEVKKVLAKIEEKKNELKKLETQTKRAEAKVKKEQQKEKEKNCNIQALAEYKEKVNEETYNKMLEMGVFEYLGSITKEEYFKIEFGLLK